MRLAALLLLSALAGAGGASPALAADKGPPRAVLRVLFLGNSFTGRHDLPELFRALAEEGHPGLRVEVLKIIYSGSRLERHWHLESASFVRRATLTLEEVTATLAQLETRRRVDPDKHVELAVQRHRELRASLALNPAPWDVVVLQSYNDDEAGAQSTYATFVRKFAPLVAAQGGRVVLYLTAPGMQNARPLPQPPNAAPVLSRMDGLAPLAREVSAAVAPMPLVLLRAQTEHPRLTFRFESDFHPNHTMAYATACTLYAAVFDRSPEGLAFGTVTDNKSLDERQPDRDRDGNSITRVFSPEERQELQRLAWEGFLQFKHLLR